MQDKLMMFAVGLVAGIILSTGTFFIFEITRNSNNNSQFEFERPFGIDNSSRPELPNGEFEPGSNEQFNNGNRKSKSKTKKGDTQEFQDSNKNDESI